MTAIKVEPISPSIGAYVYMKASDVDSEAVAAQLVDALNTYNVLVFPEIGISDTQLVTLSNKMGVKEEVKATADGSAPSNSGVYRIALDKDDKTQLDYVKGNDYWHMDGTSYNIPGKGTLLKCETPPNKGGETEFANLYAAYAALPNERKQQLQNLRVVHCLAAVGIKLYTAPTADDFARWNAVFPDTQHPLIWHQKSGQSSMLIGSTASRIEGMPEAEGKALLQELLDWATRPQFTYRHTWKRGDLVIFNNPGLLHRSLPYTESAGRVMHRVTLKGEESIA